MRLRRLGRFVLLGSAVVTSARKLRVYSRWEVFGTLLRLALGGPKALRRREGLELWYGERRLDSASSDQRISERAGTGSG